MDRLLGRKSFIIPTALLVLTLVLSILLYLIYGGTSERRVLFFPDRMSVDQNGEAQIKGESRYLPVYATDEENIELLVRELLLGPEYLVYDRAVPRETKLNTLILSNDKLYLDFSIDIIAAGSGESILHFDDVINLIKKTVEFNFKKVRTVNVTVDGQIPGSSFYAGRPE